MGYSNEEAVKGLSQGRVGSGRAGRVICWRSPLIPRDAALDPAVPPVDGGQKCQPFSTSPCEGHELGWPQPCRCHPDVPVAGSPSRNGCSVANQDEMCKWDRFMAAGTKSLFSGLKTWAASPRRAAHVFQRGLISKLRERKVKEKENFKRSAELIWRQRHRLSTVYWLSSLSLPPDITFLILHIPLPCQNTVLQFPQCNMTATWAVVLRMRLQRSSSLLSLF